MIRNKQESVEKLSEYIGNISNDEITIVDLINFLAKKCGAKIDNTDKIRRLDNLLTLNHKILLVLVDGLGAYKVAGLEDDSILKSNIKAGIKTVNPTSTACVITSLCSGKYPSEHGIFGWWQYDRKNDLSYYPLRFLERKTGMSLNEKGFKEKDIFHFESIFDKFRIPVNVYMERDLVNSEYSKFSYGKKANRYGCYSIKEAFEKISNKLSVDTSASFNHLYISGLDTASHMYGINSHEAAGIIKEVEDGIKKVKEDCGDVSVIVIADHGQIDMKEHLYLNQSHDYTKYFYASPSIDTRIISFFVKEDSKEKFEIQFIKDFGDDAVLLTKEEFINTKILGSEKLSEAAKNSLGEYVAIILNDKFMISDKVSLEDYISTKGNHSGLTNFETTIPLILI